MLTGSVAIAAERDALKAENERLRIALDQALIIAVGSGADFDWSVQERLRELKTLCR